MLYFSLPRIKKCDEFYVGVVMSVCGWFWSRCVLFELVFVQVSRDEVVTYCPSMLCSFLRDLFFFFL